VEKELQHQKQMLISNIINYYKQKQFFSLPSVWLRELWWGYLSDKRKILWERGE
jgi:hypothetical protein